MTVDREGRTRCKCGAVADVLLYSRWICIDCVGASEPVGTLPLRVKITTDGGESS